MDDDGGILRFDLDQIRARLELNEAGSSRGCVCRACGSITPAEDQALLLLVARVWVDQQTELMEKKEQFRSKLAEACRLLAAGLEPYPGGPPPSVN